MDTFKTPIACCCCFGEVSYNSSIVCPSGHITCVECINRAVAVALGNRTLIRCFHQSNCQEPFSETALNYSITDSKLKMSYDNIVICKALQGMKIDNLHQCPFCDNACIFEKDHDAENMNAFDCSQCKKVSCIKCMKMLHDGPCDTSSHMKEERETEKFAIKCCGTLIIRGDGCNKIRCTNCQTLWCWICKYKIKGYDHFDNLSYGGKKENCPLYGECKEEKGKEPVIRPVIQPVIQPVIRPVIQSVIRVRSCGALTIKGYPCKNKPANANVYCGIHSHRR